MKVVLAKFCDYACRLEGGKGSLIGMFDTIGGSQFPLTHPVFYICVELEFDPLEAGTEKIVKMILIDEDGKELMGVEGQILVPPAHEGKPAMLFQSFRIDGLTFQRPGHYRLDITCNGEIIGESRLYLVQGPPAPPGFQGPLPT